MSAICRNMELTLQLERAERELQVMEKLVKDAPKPQPIDTTYFHDVGVSLFSDHLVVEHLRHKISELKFEKSNLQKAIGKPFGISLENSEDKTKSNVSKITFASFSEIIEMITNALCELVENMAVGGAADASGLKLFVHDRLGHGEPPLHYNSWEQRFQQRVASAKDEVGKVRQTLIDVVNSTGNNFQEHLLVADAEKWTAFVALIDDALVSVLTENLKTALSTYVRQFEGKHVRELFTINVKLNQACNIVMIPSPKDLSSKLSSLFRQAIFGICPDNAVAHVISRPTNLTKEPSISTRKKCIENASIGNILTKLDGCIGRDICENIALTSESIEKEWGRYWSPSMISSDAPTLLRSVSVIQSQFVVNYPIRGGAILLNAFPLQDSILSMIHVQIENAKDDEIKALVDVWTKAVESKTLKGVSALTGNSVIASTAHETRSLEYIGQTSAPSCDSDEAFDAKITKGTTFDPLAYAARVLRGIIDSELSAEMPVPKNAEGTRPTVNRKEIGGSDPASGVAHTKEMRSSASCLSQQTSSIPVTEKLPNPSNPVASAPVRSQAIPTTRAPYTTMTVEEVKDSSLKPNQSLGDSQTIIGYAEKDVEITQKHTTPFASTTSRNVSDSAAEFRRRVEEANNATAAAAQRKEELRQNSPRSPNRKLSAIEADSPTKTAPQPPPIPSSDRRPSLSNTSSAMLGKSQTEDSARIPPTDTSSLKSIVKNASSSDLQRTTSNPSGLASTARRTVEFDPKTTTGGNGPSMAFKKASAPPEDDDETILRKLMQKEKESMERIRLMKEKDELRRKEIAAAHRRAVAEEETYVHTAPSLAPIQVKELPPLNTATVGVVRENLDSPNAKRDTTMKAKAPSAVQQQTQHTPTKSPERESIRPVLGAIRNPPSQQNTPRDVKTSVSSGLSSPLRNAAEYSAPLFTRTANPLISDPLRPETLTRTSVSAANNRPDSALRRKLALPSVQHPSAIAHQPSPPPPTEQSSGLQSLRKPQTAPVSSVANAGNNTPRGSSMSNSSPLLDPRTHSLLDIYKNCCSQLGIKPNSGLLKMLPKTSGENISKINLDLNYIGVRGFQPLLQILKVNRGLTFLNLKDNNLENNEIRSLVSVLCTESGDMLQHLDLSNNPISLAGGSSLLDLIAKQTSLTSVVINGTLIQPKMIEKITEAVAQKAK